MRSTLPLALALSAAAALAAPRLQAQEKAQYSLKPGDKVTAEIFTAAGSKVKEVTGERVVDRNGQIFLPYVGSIRVEGLDQVGLRELLYREYGRFYPDPVVNVKVQLRVNVTGSVRAPGQFFLDPTARLIDALAAAGGMFSEVAVSSIQIPADQAHVRLVRNGNAKILDFRPDAIKPEIIAMRIQSGDWLHVPPRRRSHVRDEITFWGSVVSFTSSAVALILLIRR